MATTSRKAAPDRKTALERREVAGELIELHRALKPQFGRMAELEAELKAMATAEGQSFREFFGRCWVSVSPATAAEFRGDVPVIQTEAWLGLTPAERKQLEKSGLIKIEPQWGRASSGRVSVKVY